MGSRRAVWLTGLALVACGALAGGAEGPTLPDPAGTGWTSEEALRAAPVLAWPQDPGAPLPFADHPGGLATLPPDAPQRLDQPAPGLDAAARADLALGLALFDKIWVPAPSSTRASDGLGPRMNAHSCAECHPALGRGAPDAAGPRSALVLRIQPPDPALGAQIQTLAALGLDPEARIVPRWQTRSLRLADGAQVTLRQPFWQLARPRAKLTHGHALSPRFAPALIGLGLIDAVPEVLILAWADPEDRDDDGISGRPSWTEGGALGRFGWKAEQAGLAGQVVSALHLDLGLSSPGAPEAWGDCTAQDRACRAAVTGEDAGLRDGREVPQAAVHALTRALADLGVPGRRHATAPQVLRGQGLFFAAGCAACHRPALVTSHVTDAPQRDFQLIRPWSDYLLHDMGPDLADQPGPAGEWRTAPLWALGLRIAESPAPRYLHDGRAESLDEAILWHGGEAEAARDAFRQMTRPDRAALIAFLKSL